MLEIRLSRYHGSIAVAEEGMGPDGCGACLWCSTRFAGGLVTFLSKTKTKRTSGDARPFLNLGQPLRRESVAGYGSSLGHARSVLKVILQNLGCQCRHDLVAWGLHGTD